VKLLVVAGEVSGDQHASALLAALKARVPAVDAFGVGGDGCRQEGMRLLAHQKDLAVVGLVEALAKLRFARRLLASLVAEAAQQRADAAVLIDSPDFNLPLSRRLAKAGIPVVFYVSPQVWAWRSSRAKTIAAIGRAVLVLFRFEKRWWDSRGLGERVTWVGHPLVDQAAEELARPAAPPPEGVRRVVLMPGSRAGEIRRNLPVLRDAVRLLRKRRSDLEIVLVQADSIPSDLLRKVAGPDLDSWRVVTGPHLALLAASDVVLVASGTATLEAALCGAPMVVVYRTSGFSHLIAKSLVQLRWISLVNIVAGEEVVPELIQDDFTAENLDRLASELLGSAARVAAMKADLVRVSKELGPPGASARAANFVLTALAAPASGDRQGSPRAGA